MKTDSILKLALLGAIGYFGYQWIVNDKKPCECSKNKTASTSSVQTPPVQEKQEPMVSANGKQNDVVGRIEKRPNVGVMQMQDKVIS